MVFGYAQIVHYIGKLFLVRAANASSLRKEIDYCTKKNVLSIPNYVIKKNPSRGGRHGPTERQRIYYNAHNMLRGFVSDSFRNWVEVLYSCNNQFFLFIILVATVRQLVAR